MGRKKLLIEAVKKGDAKAVAQLLSVQLPSGTHPLLLNEIIDSLSDETLLKLAEINGLDKVIQVSADCMTNVGPADTSADTARWAELPLCVEDKSVDVEVVAPLLAAIACEKRAASADILIEQICLQRKAVHRYLKARELGNIFAATHVMAAEQKLVSLIREIIAEEYSSKVNAPVVKLVDKIQAQQEVIVGYEEIIRYDSTADVIAEAKLEQKKLAEIQEQHRNAELVYESTLAERDLSTALELFGQAISLDPANEIFYYQRGLLLVMCEKFILALEDFQQAAQLGINIIDFYRAIWWVYVLQNNYAEAVEYFNKVRQLDKHCYLELLESFHKELGIDLNLAEVYQQMGRALKDKGFWLEAIEVFTEALRLNSQLPGVHSDRAVTYLQVHYFSEALADFNLVLQGDPKDSFAYAGRGMIKRLWAERASDLYKKIQLMEAVVKDYEKAAEYCSDHQGTLAEFRADLIALWQQRNEYVQMHSRLAKLDLDVPKNFNEALSLLNRLIKVNSNDAGAYVRRAMIYLRCGRQEEAFVDFNCGYELGDRSADVFFGIGKMYFAQGNDKEAIKNIVEAIRLNPVKFRDTLYELGKSLYDQIPPDYRALRYFDAAIVRLRIFDDIKLYLARAQARSMFDMLYEALYDFDRVLQQDSENVTAWMGKGRIYENLADMVDDEKEQYVHDACFCYKKAGLDDAVMPHILPSNIESEDTNTEEDNTTAAEISLT